MEERIQRLENLRQRASQRGSLESIDDRRQCLEERKYRRARYGVKLRNHCPTCKIAVCRDVDCGILGIK